MEPCVEREEREREGGREGGREGEEGKEGVKVCATEVCFSSV